ncbi:MAG: RNA polymerase sigma factor [Actinobacteria bacterium]|nr:RNA polymerase sigma factor [Actinomycetota bacterium]
MRRNDGELIAASIDDADAFGELFDRHYAIVHQFIHRRLGVELADELSSETFVQAFKSRDSYDAGKPDAAPWLFGIASNLIRNHARTEVRKLRAYARSGVDPVEEFAAATDARLAAGADRRTLVAALAKLSKDEREVILMFAWAELTTAQIAEAIGTAEGTVRSRLSRARKKIRDRLEAEKQKHARQSNRQEVGG